MRHRKASIATLKCKPGRMPRRIAHSAIMRSAPRRFPKARCRRWHESTPRYPLVSCTLIGRLAVAKDQQGQRLGSILPTDALQRAFDSASTVGTSMVIVDALDEGRPAST